MKRFAYILLLIGLCISCSKYDDSQFTQIKYGTSFGMCVGYCKHELTLKSGTVTYSRSGWVDSVETITCTESLADSGWESFKTGLDLKTFFELHQTIGCPDCADGGAEWIEIETASGRSHKVTFEYMNEPEVLKIFIIGLREQIAKSDHCGEY